MDQYEENLEISSEKLKECLYSRDLKSCLSCPEVTERCDIHQNYVDSVYKSMAKDSSGGFDF